MTTRPKVSVLIPAFNSSATIGHSIRSALSQHLSDLEIIVADDGSTDSTPEVVTSFVESDSRIALINQANRGPSAARNGAWASARGTFVSLLDADDLWLPTYLGEMVTALERAPKAVLAYTDAWVIDDRLRRIRRSTAMAPWIPPEGPSEQQDVLLEQLLHGNFFYNSATLRRSALEEFGGFDERLRRAEDYELWLRIVGGGGRTVRVPGPLAVYRERGGSLSSDRATMLKALCDVYRIVRDEHRPTPEARMLATARLDECATELEEAAKSSRSRARALPGRMIRRLRRTANRRRTFYVDPPPAIAQTFPDLRAL